ncbi:MAG: hypothetical protein KKF46_00305 [Nanoarchaeota archaeon]|nr:hypothetical protein [Nanoarchaeota archaeon]MBU1320775.1 hypothetical protein [Nanoarchaeota archaeon]MBU1598142.1 hypothetical protein [Nanoarchaeota archaeon]MBU2442203.1 hypothetical protein [Nanoarchaeota archaeon]
MSHILINRGKFIRREDTDRKLDIFLAEMSTEPPYQASLMERVKHYLTPKTWKAKYDLARLNHLDKIHDYRKSRKSF